MWKVLQADRERKYLEKYLPMLNTIIISSDSGIDFSVSLYNHLKSMRSHNILSEPIKYKGISIYVYRYINGKIANDYLHFSSINKSSITLAISRETISIYLDTYVTFKYFIFVSSVILNIPLVEKLISDNLIGLNLNHHLPVKVWSYHVKEGVITLTIYNSINIASKAIGIHHTHLTNTHLDNLVKGGFKNNYLFSYKLNSDQLNYLKDWGTPIGNADGWISVLRAPAPHFEFKMGGTLIFSLIRKDRHIKVWIYNAITLDLIDRVFSSAHSAGRFLTIDYRTVLTYLNSDKPLKNKGNMYYLLSKELSDSEKAYFNENKEIK